MAAVEATEFANRRLSTLSGGQRQRVAIAEALVSAPRLVVLDEPLAALEMRSQREIVALLVRLHRELSAAILVVAHDLNPLLPLIDSAIYLLDGRPRFAATTDVLDDTLLTHLYGTPIRIAHGAQGERYIRSVL